MRKKEYQFGAHHEGDSGWAHQAQKVKTSALAVAVVLTMSFSLIELFGGIWANSLALIGDAGHMITDSASLFFALMANYVARRGVDHDHSFGHGRVEVLAAFINGLALLGLVGWIFWEAYQRIDAPQRVQGAGVMLIAFVGLCINLVVAWSLSRDKENINTRAALLHVLGDLLGSVAAIVAGGIIWMGGPAIVDPILSVFVGLLLLHATYEILSEASHVLMDAVPEGIDFDEVGKTIEGLVGVKCVHDLHIWTMSPGHGAMQCHVMIDSPECWPKTLDAIRRTMQRKYGLTHVTIQPEWEFQGDEQSCAICRMDYQGEVPPIELKIP